MAKLTPEINKCFALASVIGASLYANHDGNIRLNALVLQSRQAMRVYASKVGMRKFHFMTDEVAKLFEKLTANHGTTIKIDEMPIFIESLCTLIPPQHFKKFFGISPFRTNIHTMRPEKYASISNSLLKLNDDINNLLGTKSYTLPVQKKKIIKVKQERDKSSKVTKQKTKSSKAIKESNRKKNVKSFLQDKIAKAKEQK